MGCDTIVSESIKRTNIYQTLQSAGISGISASDIYTAAQAIKSIAPEDIMEYVRFLNDIWQLVCMSSEGKRQTEEDNSNSINAWVRGNSQALIPSVTGYVSSNTTWSQHAKKWNHVEFDSTAGGSIDSDPELVPAKAGYYGVIDKLLIIPASQQTPVFEIQEGSTQIGQTVSPGQVGAACVGEIDAPRFGGTDNTALSFDGSGCSGLGNAVSYDVFVVYHYET